MPPRGKRKAKATPKAPKKKAAPAKPKQKQKRAASGPIAIPDAPPSFRDTARILDTTPQERPLTDEERIAMEKVAASALRFLDREGIGAATDPGGIVVRIGNFLDAVRAGSRPMPESQDVRIGLGVLWGEQLRAQVGWLWVHLRFPNHFESYALVPDDRAFACFPINRLEDLMQKKARTNTSVRLFETIRAGELPTPRKRDGYLVLG